MTAAESGEGFLYCSILRESLSIIGTLEPTITIPFYTTVTKSKSTDPVSVYISKGTKTVITSTSYSSQPHRTPDFTRFTRPLPSCVEPYPTSRVSSACSCLVPNPNTYTQYRRCDILATTSVEYTTLTYTTGVPGTKTKTYIYTDTTTRYRRTTAPFPTACPDADGVPYIGPDRSIWERACGTYLYSYRPLKDDRADDFDGCIDKCIAFNQKEGFSRCQGVQYDGTANGTTCQLVNEPGFYGIGDGGTFGLATLNFYETSTTLSDYCATLTAQRWWN
ncbi:MAG: hypothetical protein Q9190_003327 [Brigantiaea leucoxantha]